MRKWVITALIVAGLVLMALTAQRWLTPLLNFVSTNTDVIQGLSDLGQIGLWVCAAVALVAGLWRAKRSDSKPLPATNATNNIKADKSSVAIGRDAKDSTIITGGEADVVVDRKRVDGDFVAGNKITYTHEGATPTIATVTALHQLPAPPNDFTGRAQELDELTTKISFGGVNISGLQGMGGIGKTALALVLAERLKPRYPDAQFYLDLKGTTQPLSVAAALSHVIRAYHPTVQLPDGEAELKGIYQSVLHNQHALLLMDNAADREQVEPLIPPDGCVLLVTSRNRFALPGLFAKDLNTMPPEDADKLLLAITPRIADHAGAIAKLCGYLPLALRLAASALAERKDLSPPDYLRRLADAQQRLKLLDVVEASLNLSYELLQPEMQKLWRTLAVFPDTFDVAATAAVWEKETDAAQDALSELVKFSLVEWDETTARYRLHDLARLFADARMSEAERNESRRLHATHFLNVLGEADDLYLQGNEALMRGLILFGLESANIQAGQKWSSDHAGEDDAAASLCMFYPNAGVYVLDLRQHPRERINWMQAALTAARRSKNRANEAAHSGNLGLAYADLGETQRAIEFHEQYLVISREIGDRRGEGNALGNLGATYAGLGETQRAIKFYEQALLIDREIGDRRGEGADLGNLGLAYADLGETQRAIESYEQTLDIYREIGDRQGEGGALGNLGLVYAALGETQRAIKFYEQALPIVREIGDRRGEGNALGNMSLALDELGDRAQAIICAEVALKIFEEIESPHAGWVRERLTGWRGQE